MIDKENSLTFHNITQTMKNHQNKTMPSCAQHSQKAAKYRNKDNLLLYCISCAIQEASRGAVLEQLSKSVGSDSGQYSTGLLQEVYEQSQDQIQESIRIYNLKYQRLQQAITDMQIRDLISFNRKIEENHTVYKRLKETLPRNMQKQTLVDIFDNPNSQPIFQRLDLLFRSITSRNQQSSTGSPIAVSKNSSPQLQVKNRSQPIDPQNIRLKVSNNSFQGHPMTSKHTIRQSFAKSQPNTFSYQTKTSQMEQTKKNKLQDTPESVKNMMEQGGLRVTSDMAVTMFEKIDICESIDMVVEDKSSSKASKCSGRRNRYEGEV